MSLDNLTKAFGLILVLAYIFGFVIVNLYLSNFNFIDYTFFHVKYIPAGICFLVFFSFTAGAFLKTEDVVKKHKGRVVFLVLYSVFLVILLSVLFALFFSRLDGVTGSERMIWGLDAAVWFTLIIISIFSVQPLFHSLALDTSQKKEHPFMSVVHNSSSFLYSICSFLLCLWFFANFLYPSAPIYFGGGRPIDVIIETEDAGHIIRTTLIYQTPEYLLIEGQLTGTKVGNTLVPSRLVKSVNYISTSPYLADTLIKPRRLFITGLLNLF